MSRTLNWLFRPTVLIGFSVVLVAAAMLVVMPLEPSGSRPQPAQLRPDEQEIVWLYPATSTTQWERLANAVEQACERLHDRFPGLRRELDPNTSSSTLTAPRITLHWPNGRLVFRWYKLTSQWTPEAWLTTLLERDPPPLAIIGGNNSFWARELALQLRQATLNVPETRRPLLLVTTATADNVPAIGQGEREVSSYLATREEDATSVPLWSIYPERTFRFCFSNRQMATAVTRFIWSHPELAPDSDPAYLARWTDDPYSRDFFEGCKRVLPRRAAESFLQDWVYLTGAITLGLPAPALVGWQYSAYSHEGDVPIDIDSSVGTFTSPNPYEANAVVVLLKQLRSDQRRPLLLVTGQQQPARRFLRDLARSDPEKARRFVVGMGDAISFNTIYRDRQVMWPIQDLPFSLVFFAHRNPIDPTAGFRQSKDLTPTGRTLASGTEDVLLFRDIVEACALASRHESQARLNAEGLATGLKQIRLHRDRLQIGSEGVQLFGDYGQRASGTGEHIVYVRPQFEGQRVKPYATIEVWFRQGGVTAWKRLEPPLTVSFHELESHDDPFQPW